MFANPAVLSLLALLLAIGVSMGSRINVGLLAVALAWVIGVYAADLSAAKVLGGFPSSLFLTLTGVTLLFAIAEVNGTLHGLAQRALHLARGDRRIVPFLLFLIACLLSATGPGSISSVALVIPVAMSIGISMRLPPFLIALMVANGANAGNLSPISAVGIIANSRMAIAGISGEEFKVMLANLLAHVLVTAIAYLIFVLRDREAARLPATQLVAPPALDARQRATTLVLVLWIAGVIGLKLDVGLSAFAATCILLLARTAEEADVIRKMPWQVLLMVCGVATLVALLEQTGGMDLFTALLARLATADSVNGVMALVTGVISAYSSTSGVVLPAFLPTIPDLLQRVGGGDPLALALSINVGSALVDVAPISTLGALCVAALPDQSGARRLFLQLLGWGLAMTVVGGILCQLFAGALAAW
ncbi:MAG: C4-dicarboxylate ABC transporter [Gammaproteobacteria bacterium]|nr:C4-dicarboxylate ABC transporter [Gammaproteobacteria bacterium]